MLQPDFFTWIEKPILAASAGPTQQEELEWLREQGIDIVISLTEVPLPRRWVDDAGLMMVHIPIFDMTAPSQREMEECLQVIRRAAQSKMGVLIHCAAGKGRTGTIVAGYLTAKGMSGQEAIEHTRSLRPGSIETREQEAAVMDFARNRKG